MLCKILKIKLLPAPSDIVFKSLYILKVAQVVVFLAFTSFITSCSKEERKIVVNDELKDFVDSFVKEGKKRGVELSIEGLEALLLSELGMDLGSNVCGYGSYYNNDYQKIEILQSENCWTQRTFLEKENLLYHELGHALLGRGHVNQTLPNQATQKSIMCTQLCNNFKVFQDEGPMREYYLDELFNQAAIFPAAIMNKEFERIVYDEGFEEDSGEYLTIFFNRATSESTYTVVADSIKLGAQVIHGLNIRSESLAGDSIIVFRSFELMDFKAHSNLKATAKIIANDFDGHIDFGMSIRDRNDSSFYGLSSAEREYHASHVNGDIEIEFYDVSSRTELVTIYFKIYSNNPIDILIDKIEVKLLE